METEAHVQPLLLKPVQHTSDIKDIRRWHIGRYACTPTSEPIRAYNTMSSLLSNDCEAHVNHVSYRISSKGCDARDLAKTDPLSELCGDV